MTKPRLNVHIAIDPIIQLGTAGFCIPKKAKKSWLARNLVSNTEQPINLLTISALPFNVFEPSPAISKVSQMVFIVEEPTFLSETTTSLSSISFTIPKKKELMATDISDPSLILFDGISELDLDLMNTFCQEDMGNIEEEFELLVEQEITQSETESSNPELPSLNRNWSQETEEAMALPLD